MIGGFDPEVKAAVDAAVKQLESLGATVEEICHTEYAAATYYIIAPAEASANLGTLRRHPLLRAGGWGGPD